MLFENVDATTKSKKKCPNFQNEIVPKNSTKQYYFAFGHLGKSFLMEALKHSKKPDLLFFDPNKHYTPITYNSFFDPHLRKYFKNKKILNHLYKNNLITKMNKVICSFKEFNDYRKILYHLESEAFKDVMNSIKTNNLKHNSKSVNNVSQIPKIIKKNEMDEVKNAKLSNKIKVYENRQKRIKILRNLKENEMKERGLYRNLEICKKQIYVMKKRKPDQEQLKSKISKNMQFLDKRIFDGMNKEGAIDYIIHCPKNQ